MDVIHILVIEARVKLGSGSTSAATRAPIVVAATTSPNVGSALWIGEDEIFINNADFVKGPTANVDTDDAFHTYRIEVTGASVDVFYDGALTLTGSTFTSVPGATRNCVRSSWGFC